MHGEPHPGLLLLPCVQMPQNGPRDRHRLPVELRLRSHPWPPGCTANCDDNAIWFAHDRTRIGVRSCGSSRSRARVNVKANRPHGADLVAPGDR
jgi:hypothetical protein